MPGVLAEAAGEVMSESFWVTSGRDWASWRGAASSGGVKGVRWPPGPQPWGTYRRRMLAEKGLAYFDLETTFQVAPSLLHFGPFEVTSPQPVVLPELSGAHRWHDGPCLPWCDLRKRGTLRVNG